jgi:hypothetical protein
MIGPLPGTPGRNPGLGPVDNAESMPAKSDLLSFERPELTF